MENKLTPINLLEKISSYKEKDISVEKLKSDFLIDTSSFNEFLLELIKRGIVFESKPGYIQHLERKEVPKKL